MIESYRLADVRRAIRRYLNALPDDEPVDLIFLASVIANFDPDRSVPHWLVILGIPGRGKTKLIEMIAGWYPVFYMVTGISQGFFLSTRKEVKDPALKRIKRDRKRIMLWSDVSGLTSINRNYAAAIHAQLIAVHDGRLYRESGMTGESIDVSFTPSERLGFIAAGTTAWYDFQRQYQSIGTRFSSYYIQRDRWASTQYLDAVTNIDQQEGSNSRYEDACSAVTNFLNYALENIDDMKRVTISDEQRARLNAMVALIIRVLSSPEAGGDSGARLAIRSNHLARVIAFINGQSEPNEYDMQVVLRFILSQANPNEQAVIRFAARNKGAIEIQPLLDYTGGTRRTFTRLLYDLVDLGILTYDRKKSIRFLLSKTAANLLATANLSA